MPESSLGSVAKRERTRREIEHRCDRLAALPEVVLRTLELLARPDTEPAAIERQLRHDQVLVAKLLGLVNSPFYGLRRPVTNLPGAIMVVGFRGLQSVLLASAATGCLQHEHACHGHAPGGLLAHSVAVATVCRLLAQAIGHDADSRDDLFVAGLLHDIGKLLVGPYLEQARLPNAAAGASMVEVERRVVGLDHQEAGTLVAAKWNLGPAIRDVLGHHHDDDGPQDASIPLAAVRLADAVAHELELGYRDGEAPAAVFLERDLEVVGLRGAAWDRLRAGAEDAVAAAVAALR